MKTNKLFSRKLYTDGLKQLSTIAIDSLVILAIFCIIYYVLTGAYDELGSVVVVFSELFCLTFMPLMAFYILRFSHKRNSCDFYYSLPYSRVCISLSYLGAVITYSFALTLLLIPALPKRYTISGRFAYFAGQFATYLLICAAIYFAWTLTNTLFSHIVLSGLILFVPQVLISYISDYIYGACTFLDNDHRSMFLNGNLNLFIHNFYVNSDYDYIPGIIYTTILAIIYFILSIIFTKKKLSEEAGSEANNRIVRIITGCIISLYICLSTIYGIVDYFYYTYNVGLSILGVILIYFIAIGVYFIYQFISTRTVKTLKSSLIGIPILAAINLLIIGIILISCNTLTKFKPEAEEIDYVSFTSDVSMYELDNSYYSHLISEIKFDDSETKEIISKALKNTIKLSKTEDSYSYYYENDYNRLATLINVDGTKYYRTLRVKTGVLSDLKENILENEEFIKLASTLPGSEHISDFYFYSDIKTSYKDIVKIYDIYREEVKSLSLDEQSEIILTAYEIGNDDSDLTSDEFNDKYWDTGLITIYYSTEDSSTILFLNITENTPKAYAMLQELLRKEQ